MSSKKQLDLAKSTLGAAIGTAIVGLTLLATGARAEDPLTSSGDRASAPAPAGDLTARVRQALHSDPGLYDKHIDVSMEKGKVVLRGFVSSADDLRKALKAANGAVGDEKKVVNNLTIKEGGDGGSG